MKLKKMTKDLFNEKQTFSSKKNEILQNALVVQPAQELKQQHKTAMIRVLNQRSESLKLFEKRSKVTQEFSKKWEAFFLSLKEEQKQGFQNLKEQTQVGFTQVIIQQAHQNRLLYEQNKKLEKLNKELFQKIEFLVDEAKALKNEKDQKLRLKEKRQKAKKKATLDIVSSQEYKEIINCVNNVYQGELSRARAKIAILLLYLTGLRISNLLTLRWRDFFELRDKGETLVQLIKKGEQRHFLNISTTGQKMLQDLTEEINILKERTKFQEDGPLFTPSRNQQQFAEGTCLARSKFTNFVNAVLIEASKKLKKNLRSHSFRATFVTDLLINQNPIHVVKDLLGHKNIATTIQYKRNPLTRKEVRSVMVSLSKKRFASAKKKTSA